MRRLRRGVVAGASLAAIALAQGISPWGPVVLAAGNLYVDINNSVSCSDTGPGSLTQPYCHISPAATAATAGTSVLVNTGTYLENVTVAHSGSSGSPISFAPNSGQSVTISGQMHGFTISAKSYIVISGFTITSTTGTGINVGTSSNITITGNTVTGTAGAGINVVASSSITVSNNTVTGAGQRLAPTLTQTFTAPGIQLSGNSSSLVTHNTSDNNSDHGILVSNGSANNVVSFNEASLNAEGWQRAATGISVTGTGSTGNTLLGNVTHDNEDTGLQFYTGANNGVAIDNVTYNNGDHGIDNHNVTGGVLTGNTVYHNCTTGINVEATVGSTPGSNTIENNIAVDNAYNGNPCARGTGNIGVSSLVSATTTADYNLVNLGSHLYVWAGVSYSSITALHAATGQEAHGVAADPMWVNPAGADFHLQAGSPAIDSANAGAPAEPSVDIEGKPRADDPATPNTGAGPRDYDDRGAYEFQPTVSDTVPPTVPAGLAATASPTPLQVNLSWSASTDSPDVVTGYTVYRGGIVLAEVSGTTLTYTDAAVTRGTKYTYTVDAFDASGNHSAQSAPVTVITPPSVPAGVSATALTTRQVNVSWNASTDNVGPAGYTVYRNGTALTTVSGSTLTYADKTVADLTLYSYTVDAFDAAGNHSAQSAAASVTTLDYTPPSVPTGVSATALSTPQVSVGWSASTDNVRVTGYTVYRNGTALATVSGSMLTYADTTVAGLTSYSYTVDAFDAAGNHSAQSAPASLVTPGYTSYTAVTPVRLLDTRTNGTTLGDGGSLNLAIGGVGGVPANATAVVLNVTATNGSTGSFFTVYPTGVVRPTASNLNWSAHETVPNLVTVGLGSGGQITIYNGVGTADAVVDLEGYYAPSAGTSAGEYVPVVPSRITDTRPGSGKPNSGLTLGPLGNLNVQVTGMGGIPATGVSAVILNVTATNTTAAGFFTVFPAGASLPVASNLNWTAGMTVPNRVIVPVGSGGMVSFHNGMGNADLIVDIGGYFTDSTSVGGSFSALVPSRIVDTRNGTGGFSSPVGQGQIIVVTVAGSGGVPGMASANPPRAVVLNVTVDGATADSDLTVWPDGASAPVASDLNFSRGQTVANLVIVKLSPDGKIDIRNDFGSTNVIIDVVGWYG